MIGFATDIWTRSLSAIDCSHLFTMAGSVSIACLSVKFFSSCCLLGGGWEFRSRLLLFLLCCSTMLFSFQNGLSILHIPFTLILFHGFQISVRHDETGVKGVRLYLSSCPPIIALGPGMAWVEGIWYPWGFHPWCSSCRSNPSTENSFSCDIMCFVL